MEFMGLPPSTNHAYFEMVVKKGKRSVPIRSLTKEGRAYKKEVKAKVVKDYGLNLQSIKKNTPYGLSIQLFFPQLINKGWPTTVETRYKKLDASNRTKLLEDSLVDALGIDDSQFLQVTIAKSQGEAKTRVWIWEIEEK